MTDENSSGAIYLVSPRRVVEVTLPSGAVVWELEPLDEWAARCGMIKNVAEDAGVDEDEGERG